MEITQGHNCHEYRVKYIFLPRLKPTEQQQRNTLFLVVSRIKIANSVLPTNEMEDAGIGETSEKAADGQSARPLRSSMKKQSRKSIPPTVTGAEDTNDKRSRMESRNKRGSDKNVEAISGVKVAMRLGVSPLKMLALKSRNTADCRSGEGNRRSDAVHTTGAELESRKPGNETSKAAKTPCGEEVDGGNNGCKEVVTSSSGHQNKLVSRDEGREAIMTSHRNSGAHHEGEGEEGSFNDDRTNNVRGTVRRGKTAGTPSRAVHCRNGNRRKQVQ